MEIRCAAFSGMTTDSPPDAPSAPASGPARCPKCGIETPGAPECRRCGVLVDLYRGPALGAAALRPAASAAPAAPRPAAPLPPPLPLEDPAFGGEPVPVRLPPVDRFAGTFGVGDILSQTFSVFFANFVPFCLLTALALLPLFVYHGLGWLGISLSPLAGRWLGLLLTSLGSYLATAAVTYGVVQQLRGGGTTLAECLKHGGAAFVPVLGLVVVQAFAVWLGFLLCLIPGIVLSMQWAVAIPVAVTERTGIGLTLNRSTFLTDGLRWEIFGTWGVLAILQVGIGFLLGLALLAAPPGVGMILGDAVEVVTVGLWATNTAVIYYRLRSLKEGLDTAGVAAVFA
jgi:hypothetical protein